MGASAEVLPVRAGLAGGVPGEFRGAGLRRSSGVRVGCICEAKVEATTWTSMGGTRATQSHRKLAGLPLGSSGKSLG